MRNRKYKYKYERTPLPYGKFLRRNLYAMYFLLVLKKTCDFRDNDTLYRFIFDVESPLPLCKALNLGAEESHYSKGIDEYMKRTVFDPDAGKQYMQMVWKGWYNLVTCLNASSCSFSVCLT